MKIHSTAQKPYSTPVTTVVPLPHPIRMQAGSDELEDMNDFPVGPGQYNVRRGRDFDWDMEVI